MHWELLKHEELKQLFELANTGTHFMFRGSYGQMDGVAMKSPFAAVLANLFMGHHEQIWLNEYNWPSLLLCRRYVDDTFCLFNNKGDASQFFNYINK